MLRHMQRLFALFLICNTSPLLAATPTSPTKLDASTLQQQVQVDQTLRALPTQQGLSGLYHTRFQQFYRGTPVYGGYLILHTHEPLEKTLLTTTSIQTTGILFQDLEADLGHNPPTHFLRSIKREAGLTTQPIIYVDDAHHAHWAYKVSSIIYNTKGEPSRPTRIVDADLKKVYLRWNDLHTQYTHVSGIGYGGNPLMGSYAYGQEKPALSILRNDDTQLCFLENKRVKIVDMRHHYQQKTQTFSFACPHGSATQPDTYWTGPKGTGYDTINGAHSPSNDALFFAEMVSELYQKWYQLSPIGNPTQRSAPLVMRVHFGENYTNAFWDGHSMTFGDGDRNTLYPLVSLGITAHELSHGFTQHHADLAYTGQSGAINESFSDMAAIAAEAYAQYPLQWTIGHDVLKPQSGLSALRYFEHPHQDGHSFESAQQYLQARKNKSSIDVHYGSGVFNRLFYLIATAPHWSIHQAFDVMVYANVNYWMPQTQFQDGGCGILYAAQELNYETTFITTALMNVGIDPTQCPQLEVLKVRL